jgi:hypothetical protein
MSAARAGAIVALGRAKAWQAELDPEEIATGCPEYKDDGSSFEEQDFNKCDREMRPVACKLTEELNLKHYTPAYDDQNNKIKPPTHEVMILVPARRKHLFAPELDSTPIINNEAIFEALTGIDWMSPDLQMDEEEEEEEPARDDPESSTRQEGN